MKRALLHGLVLLCIACFWSSICSPETAWARRSSSGSARKHRKDKKRKTTAPVAKKTPDETSRNEATEDSASEKSVHKNKVAKYLQKSRKALAAGEFEQAVTHAETAFKKEPTGDILCLLGQIAVARSRLVEAHDFFRRCLADPTVAIDAQTRETAQRNLPRPALGSGDLVVAGEKDALVFVDQRLKASLPLVLPLRLSEGVHAVTLLSGSRSSRGSVEIPAGQIREMRFDALTSAVLLSVPPSLLFVKDVGAKLGEGVAAAIERGSQAAGFATLLANDEVPQCARFQPECLRALMLRHKPSYLLTVELSQNGGSLRGKLSLFDVELDEWAENEELACRACSMDAQSALVSEHLAAILRRGRAKPRGALEVNSIPKAAQFRQNGRLVGLTPWRGPVWAGVHRLELSLPGHETQTVNTSVAPGQQAKVSVLLPPLLDVEPAPFGWQKGPALTLRRPVWRIVTGSAAIGLGLLFTGIGGSGLAANGNCVPPLQPPAVVCRETIQTGTVGGSLLGVGLGLTLGGAILIAIPPR